MDALRDRLEQHFGAANVGTGRARFDAAEIPSVAPENDEQAAELVRFAASERLRVTPVGYGSKLGWDAPAQGVDVLLSTRALGGVTSLEPGDGTLSARAGTTMADLRGAAREAGYWLTPDVAHPQSATLGGVLGASTSGCDRLRFGPARHHVLGMRVLLADGTQARSGGQLVKNVTGYDLHRLYCGSRGTLCIVLEAALRLFPDPEAERWFELDVEDGAAMLAAAKGALAEPLRFVQVSAMREGAEAPWTLSARLFGHRAPLESDARVFAGRWSGARMLADAEARAAAESWRDAGTPDGERPWLSVRCRPSTLESVLAVVERAFSAEPAPPRLVLQHGICELRVEPTGPWRPDPAWVDALRAELRALGGARADLRNLPASLCASCPPTEPPPPAAVSHMQRLKRSLDPHGRFPPPTFGDVESAFSP